MAAGDNRLWEGGDRGNREGTGVMEAYMFQVLVASVFVIGFVMFCCIMVVYFCKSVRNEIKLQ